MMSYITQKWSEIRTHYLEYRRAKILKELTKDSKYSIQLMEFCGEPYISHNGTPIVPVSALNENAVSIIQSSREVWISFQLRHNELFHIN